MMKDKILAIAVILMLAFSQAAAALNFGVEDAVSDSDCSLIGDSIIKGADKASDIGRAADKAVDSARSADRAVDTAKASSKSLRAANKADRGEDFVNAIEKPTNAKRWSVGDPIDAPTRNGYPSWTTARGRYWKTQAAQKASELDNFNLERMQRGRAFQGIDRGTGLWSSKELHHIQPQRDITNINPHRPDNLVELWPYEHALWDKNRKIKVIK